MKSRPLDFNFSSVTTYWADNKEFAQIYNGASLVPAYLEPYLCRVMGKVKPLVPAPLHEDTEIFIKQESQHYRNHIAFNKAVSTGNPDVKALEKQLEADYDLFLKGRSLQFNLAYCEGFESTSVIPMMTFFVDFQELWAKSHPKVEAFWKWHFAEEHEHRNVVADVYQALYGRGIRAYVYRIWGLFYSMKHMNGYSTRMSDALLAKDREGMTSQELAASKARAKRVRDLAKKGAMKHLLTIMSPFYDPDKRLAPPDVFAILGLDKASAPIVGAASKLPLE